MSSRTDDEQYFMRMATEAAAGIHVTLLQQRTGMFQSGMGLVLYGAFLPLVIWEDLLPATLYGLPDALACCVIVHTVGFWYLQWRMRGYRKQYGGAMRMLHDECGWAEETIQRLHKTFTEGKDG